MQEKQRHQAKINGKEYTIVSQKSADHIHLVAKLVNQQLDHLSEMAPELTIIDRAILLAVNAVSDQVTKEERMISLEEELDKLKKANTKKADQHTEIKEKYRLADQPPRGVNRIQPNKSDREGRA